MVRGEKCRALVHQTVTASVPLQAWHVRTEATRSETHACFSVHVSILELILQLIPHVHLVHMLERIHPVSRSQTRLKLVL